MAEKPKARRCVDCDVNWPDYDSYHACPLCKQATYLAQDEKPLELSTARNARAAVHAFETQLVLGFRKILAELPETPPRPKFVT